MTLPTGIKIRHIDGVNQVVRYREINGVEVIVWKEDFAVLKQIVKAGDTGDVGKLMFHKNNKELQDFVDNVSLLQSNYQLVIFKKLLEINSAPISEITICIKNHNPNKEIKGIQKPLDLMTRKGIIRKDSVGRYEVNSDLSDQKRLYLLEVANSRLGVN